jgi:type II secretory pathway pseudopilin PulG
MYVLKQSITTNRGQRGITLLEIMTAVLILAVAFLPIIGLMSSSSRDSDVANSNVFAQTAARNILDAFLDDVPFEAIGMATAPDSGDFAYEEPARVITPSGIDYTDLSGMAELSDIPSKDYYRIEFLNIMGNNTGDGLARGELIDERGIVYKTRIFVFPIFASTNEAHDANELTFSYLPRPEYEKQDNWYVTDKTHMQGSVTSPYDMATGLNVQRYNAFQMGVEPAGTGDICVMFKVLFQMYWVNRDGIKRSIELFTLKANL